MDLKAKRELKRTILTWRILRAIRSIPQTHTRVFDLIVPELEAYQ